MISYLDLVESSDFQDSLHELKLEESNLKVEFETFSMPRTEETIFTDGLATSSFLKDTIETSSSKIRESLNEMLTSFDKDSSQFL